MRKPLTAASCCLVLSLALLCGCSDAPTSPEGRLVGKWHGAVQIDPSKVGEKLTAEQLATLTDATMEIDFQADGTLTLAGTVTGEPTESSGMWEVVSSTGKTITIKSTEGDSSQDVELIFSGNDAFSMPLPEPLADAGAMEFRRLR